MELAEKSPEKNPWKNPHKQLDSLRVYKLPPEIESESKTCSFLNPITISKLI